jgi:hypothetical protein
MYVFTTLCAYIGLLVWCIAVAALVLALGGNLHCGAERAAGGVVLVACQSPAFGGQP